MPNFQSKVLLLLNVILFLTNSLIWNQWQAYLSSGELNAPSAALVEHKGSAEVACLLPSAPASEWLQNGMWCGMGVWQEPLRGLGVSAEGGNHGTSPRSGDSTRSATIENCLFNLYIRSNFKIRRIGSVKRKYRKIVQMKRVSFSLSNKRILCVAGLVLPRGSSKFLQSLIKHVLSTNSTLQAINFSLHWVEQTPLFVPPIDIPGRKKAI